MIRMVNAGDQVVSFFVKRGKLSAELAYRHCKDQEFEKGITLYKEAYSYFLKAKQSLPEDQDLANSIEDIKQKYQQAKKDLETKK